MEVINLATRENQELILSYFPIQGGTDFSNRTYGTTLATVSSHQAKVVIDIQGKGLLHSILVCTSSTESYVLHIEVDGTIYLFDFSMAGYRVTGLPFMWAFQNNLKITSDNTPSVFRVLYSLE